MNSNLTMTKQVSTNSKPIWGAQFSLYYCLCTALSLTLINKFEVNIIPEVLTFLTFIFTTLSFHLICLRDYRKSWKIFSRHRRLFFKANIYTAITWILTFISLKHLQPAIAAVMIFGTFPLATFCIQRWRKKNFIFNHEALMTFLILLIMSLLALDKHGEFSWQYFMYISLAILAAIAGSLYNITAKKLSVANVDATTVMAQRFWGVIIVTGIYILFMGHLQHLDMQLSVLAKAFILSIVSIMLPLFFLQKAIEKTSVQLVSYFMAIVPVFIYLIELSLLNSPFIFSQFILILLLVLFLGLSTYLNVKQKSTQRLDAN